MASKKSKDYIDNVYQPHSKYIPATQSDKKLGTYYNKRPNLIREKTQDKIDNVYKPNSKYIPAIQYNKKLGTYYNERPNWIGGQTQDLSQAMSNYIFQSVNFR
jgi:hypothetical protein